MVGQQGDVLGALAQGRKLDRKNIQAVVQILPKPAVTHRLLRRSIGRSDHPHVGFLRLRGADPREQARLENAEKLDLQIERHLGHLVEEQRAAVRSFEESLVLAIGPCEAAFLVAEDLAFEQVRRHRATVHCQEGVPSPSAELMHAASNELLAGAALAGDAHRHAGRGNAMDLLVHRLHRSRTPPEGAEVTALRQLVLPRRSVPLDLRGSHDPGQHALQLLGAHRLDEVVRRSETQGLDRSLDAGMSGDQDDFRLLDELVVAEQLEAVPIGQLDVQQHEIRRVQQQLTLRVEQGACRRHRETVGGNQ